MSKERKRHGCLVFFIVVLVLLSALGFVIWRYVIHRPLHPGAIGLIEGPIDVEASRLITTDLQSTVGLGINAAVVPLPMSEQTALIIVIDSSEGFVPAPGQEGKRLQGMTAIRQIIEADSSNDLNLNAVSLTYSENGKSILAVAGTMSNLRALDAGEITEKEFAARMGLEVKDITYMKNLIGE